MPCPRDLLAGGIAGHAEHGVRIRTQRHVLIIPLREETAARHPEDARCGPFSGRRPAPAARRLPAARPAEPVKPDGTLRGVNVGCRVLL
jgi:hypothetical protein